MKYCIKLLAAAILAFGVLSAYADADTDRYMAAAGASANQQSGPMSFVSPSYANSAFWRHSHGREPRRCRFYSYCRSSAQCVGEGSSPRRRCPCLPRDLSNPDAGGTCK